MTITYLGLGTNLGDRPQNLQQAMRLLASSQLRISGKSSIYETSPRDVLDQPLFLNMVIECKTLFSAPDLLAHSLDVERQMGRVRVIEKGPRLIDIDILLFGDEVIDSGDLKIPHAGMWNRRFVLDPLVELNPHLRNPRNGLPVSNYRSEVADQKVKLYA